MNIEHFIVCEYFDKIEEFKKSQSVLWHNVNGSWVAYDSFHYCPVDIFKYSFVFLINTSNELRIATAKVTHDMCDKMKKIPWKWDDELFNYYVNFSDFDWIV